MRAGDLLRAERKSGSPDGELIASYILEGNIVPVEITVGLLAKAMAASGKAKFLIDGFPRNQNNFDGWKRVMGDNVDVEGVLFYDVDDDTRMERLLERGKTSGRTDDNAGERRAGRPGARSRGYGAGTAPFPPAHACPLCPAPEPRPPHALPSPLPPPPL